MVYDKQASKNASKIPSSSKNVSCLIFFPSKGLVLVDENVPVTSLSIGHVDNSLVGFLHRSLLDPRLDLLVGRELEHLINLSWRANGTATKLDAIGNKSESVDGRKVATIWGTDLDKGTLDFQQGEITGKRHLFTGDGRDNEVESAAVSLFPVLLVVGGNVLVGTELENLIFLAGLTRDTNDLVSTECLGEEDTEVTETANTDNTDLKGRASIVRMHQ